jgi:5,10-methylenetetrahydromethanopterin reductase
MHVRFAKLAEQLGYDVYWINDNITGLDPFVTLAEVARETRKIKLGINIAIVHPRLRDPTVIAASTATLNEVSGHGRLILGIGCGVPPLLGLIGAHLEKPLQRVREAIEIVRGLLAGETLQYNGESFRANNAKLELEGYRLEGIPIVVGAQGPKMLELGGETADGVIIPAGPLDFYRDAVKHFSDGVAKSGRKLSNMIIATNVNCFVSDDRAKAIKEAKPMLADSIASRLPPALETMGISQEMAKELKTKPELLSDEFVFKNAICGTVDDCLNQIKKIEAFGVNLMTLRPRHHDPPALPNDEEEVIRAIGERVMPRLKAR